MNWPTGHVNLWSDEWWVVGSTYLLRFIIFQHSSCLLLTKCLQKLLKMLAVCKFAWMNEPFDPTVWYTEVFRIVTSCSLIGVTNISKECFLCVQAKMSKVNVAGWYGKGDVHLWGITQVWRPIISLNRGLFFPLKGPYMPSFNTMCFSIVHWYSQ
jgi:hypothetical protein